ncbi:hypothetical protein C0993_009821 [Termitomyces sp. T159_Od127]|nr:hypothetical protein C0993_009821 [Termitomyces sp. T159_Od127]
MSFETFVEIYPFGFPHHDDFTPEESQDTLALGNELLQLTERLRIEKREWQDLEGLDLPEYKTNEEWLEAAIESGRTGKSAEELTALVARWTKISDDLEAVMQRLKKVMMNPNKKAQIRRILSSVFSFAKEDDLIDTGSSKRIPGGGGGLTKS